MTHHDLPRPHAQPWSLARSHQLLEQARALVPGLTLSMMKRPEHFAPGEFPVYLARGRGALVEDVDGNQYVDFICGLGATSLGHQHPALMSAARMALESGFVHSLPHELELQAAEALIQVVPHAEMARFFKTGADATSAAVRLARALSGKERILTVGYNGWHDQFMYDTPGVPRPLGELTTRMPLFAPSDEAPVLEAVKNGKDSLACVLLSLPYGRKVSREFLLALREECTAAGVYLVFDEIVTGFRLALGGAQELYDVRPDFSCFSKALAAGMPLSAVVGGRRTMQAMDKLQVSTTFGGELLSLAVCVRAIATYRETSYIDHIAALGHRLREGIEAAASDTGATLQVLGYDAIPFFVFDRDPLRHAARMRAFQGHMARRGVLLRRDVNFVSGVHTALQIEHTIAMAYEALEAMKRGTELD
jgi:aminotransferase MxcL